MESLPLKIQMLGEFSIQSGPNTVSDGANRSRKVWLLLAYLVYCRNRTVPSEELLDLLWGEEERGANPVNALKTMLHRVRTCLNQLGPDAGHKLILHRDGCYAWNTEVPVLLDTDQFDALYQKAAAAQEEETRLACCREALALYRGDFLPKLSSEPWVIPITAYYHSRYVQMLQEYLDMLERRGAWEEIMLIGPSALQQEPYLEELYRHLMNAQLRMGDQSGVVALYETMSERFLSDFGILPSDETTALYREAVRTVNDRTVASGVILEQLREPDDAGGAFFCEYDVFRSIYHLLARSVARSGDAVHLALISVASEQGGALQRRSLDRVMENLKELIRGALRRGDIAARCSVSQFVVLLPQANYENGLMVCDRIVKAFNRRYPHSPARLLVSLHPLEPNP